MSGHSLAERIVWAPSVSQILSLLNMFFWLRSNVEVLKEHMNIMPAIGKYIITFY